LNNPVVGSHIFFRFCIFSGKSPCVGRVGGILKILALDTDPQRKIQTELVWDPK